LKEATGELNMTVVTVVAIGAVMLFFYAIIWPTIKTSMSLTSACNGGPGYSVQGDGYSIECTAADPSGAFSCTYTDAANPNNTNTKACGSQK